MSGPDRADWAVKHTLDSVRVKLGFAPEQVITLSVRGESANKRTALWVDSRAFPAHASRLVIAEDIGVLLHNVFLAMPRSQAAYQHSQVSPHWEDVPIPGL